MIKTNTKKDILRLVGSIFGACLFSFSLFLAGFAVGSESRSNTLTASAATADNTYIDISNTIYVFDKSNVTTSSSVEYGTGNELSTSGSIYYSRAMSGNVANTPSMVYSTSRFVIVSNNSYIYNYSSSDRLNYNVGYTKEHASYQGDNRYSTSGSYMISLDNTNIDSRMYSFLNANASVLDTYSDTLSLSYSNNVITAPSGYYQYYWIINGVIQTPSTSYQLFNTNGSISCCISDNQNRLTLLEPITVGQLATPEPYNVGNSLIWDSVGDVDYQIQSLDESVLDETSFNFYTPPRTGAYRVRALGDDESYFDSEWSDYISVVVPEGGGQSYPSLDAAFQAGKQEGLSEGYTNAVNDFTGFSTALAGTAELVGYDLSLLSLDVISPLTVSVSPSGVYFSGYPATVPDYDLYYIRYNLATPQTLADLGIKHNNLYFYTDSLPVVDSGNGLYTSNPSLYFSTLLTDVDDLNRGSALVSYTSNYGYSSRFSYPYDATEPLYGDRNGTISSFRVGCASYDVLKSISIARDNTYYQGFVEGKQEGINSINIQQIKDTAYQLGVEHGKTLVEIQNNPIGSIFLHVGDVPLNIIDHIFTSAEMEAIFGFNLQVAFYSILVILLVFAVAKMLKGG